MKCTVIQTSQRLNARACTALSPAESESEGLLPDCSVASDHRQSARAQHGHMVNHGLLLEAQKQLGGPGGMLSLKCLNC